MSFRSIPIAVTFALLIGCATTLEQQLAKDEVEFKKHMRRGCSDTSDCTKLERLGNRVWISCIQVRPGTCDKALSDWKSARAMANRSREIDKYGAPLEEIKAREEMDKQNAQERQRQMEEEKRNARNRYKSLIRQRATKAEYAVPSISILICKDQELIGVLKDEMREEERVTQRAGGVMNLRERRDIGEAIVEAENRIDERKALLEKSFQASPMSCEKLLDITRVCRANISECEDPVTTYLSIIRYQFY